MPMTELLLQEILIPASNEVRANRFIADNSMASCNGKCASGVCKSIELTEALPANFYA